MTPGGAVLQADEHVRLALELVLGAPAIEGARSRLDRGALKSAYRRRAHELHPDKARARGVASTTMEREFRELKDAYDLLSRLVEVHPAITLPAAPAEDEHRPRPRAGANNPGGHQHPTCPNGPPSPASGVNLPGTVGDGWQRTLPRRRLRFAQYLFLSRLIDGPTLRAAVTWQRRSRPLCGEIARRLEYLTQEAIAQVLRERGPGERFGEAAVRLAYLDHPRLLTVLAWQRRFDRPIGRFFVERSILSPTELRDLLAGQWSHNLSYAAERLASMAPVAI